MVSTNGTGEICTPQVSLVRFDVPTDGPRHRALTRLRAWKRGWANGRGRWAKLYADTVSGSLYVDRLTAGRARPYALGDVGHALRGVLSREAVEMLGHLLGAEKAFSARGGLRLSHAVTATLIDRSRRRAGTVMRELVESGLVEVRYHFRKYGDDERPLREGGGTQKHRELTPSYSTTARCTEVVARCLAGSRKYMVGKKDQPSRIQPFLTKGPKRSARPEHVFVSELKKSRGPQREPLPIATVIERKPDGTVALGTPLTADTAARRLLRAEGVDDATMRALNAAWRSFEANGGGLS